MRNYGKIHSTFWTSESTRSLSDDAKMLALFLLTGPHTNMIGCFRLPNGYIVEDLNWSPERVSKGFTELLQKGFVTREEGSSWVFVHNHLKWNPIENPNQMKSAIRLFKQIPDTSTIKPLIATAFHNFSSKFTNPFETLLEPFRNPSETLSKPGTGTGTGTGTENTSQRSAEKDSTAHSPERTLPVENYLLSPEEREYDESGRGNLFDRDSLEFQELRARYDLRGRKEYPTTGLREYLQLRASGSFPGLPRILEAIDAHADNLPGWKTGFAIGLPRFLRERAWEVTPSAPAQQLPKLNEAQAFIARYAGTGEGCTPGDLLRTFCEENDLDFSLYAPAILHEAKE